jgi:hypothetical protein
MVAPSLLAVLRQVDTTRVATDPNPRIRRGVKSMALSPAEIADRRGIQRLLGDYSTAIGNRRFDDPDKIFTPDACIDLGC